MRESGEPCARPADPNGAVLLRDPPQSRHSRGAPTREAELWRDASDHSAPASCRASVAPRPTPGSLSARGAAGANPPTPSPRSPRALRPACRSRARESLLLLLCCALGCGDSGASAAKDADADLGRADAADVGDANPDTGDAEPDPRDTADTDVADLPDVPPGPPVVLHDPTSGDLFSFPDDYFTRQDPSTVTGLRVDVTRENLAVIDTFPATFQPVFTSLNDLDGFGTSAGGFLRTSRPLDIDSVEQNVFFGTLGDGIFTPWPIEVKLTDDDATVIVRPLLPLPPATRALLGFTTAVTGADGQAAIPGAVLQSLLDGAAEGPLARLVPRYDEAVAALIAADRVGAPADIAALSVFTTQSIVEESVAVAADIRSRDYAVKERLGCQDAERYRQCEFVFTTGNYRDERRSLAIDVDAARPTEFYDLPVTVYLPLAPTDYGHPFPTLIFGHGLGGERTQAGRLAEFAAPLGVATIAVDAPEHGDHPKKIGGGDLAILYFFGFTPTFVLEGAALRDAWRQATFDKLALIELLRGGVDVDGDDAVDLDGERIGYLGVSLGGIMGSELLSLSEDLDVGILVVPGGRVTDILQFSSLFAPLVTVLTPAGVGSGDVDRFWPVLQTTIERGDPANWGRHVIHERIGGVVPDVLMGMVLDDEVVPEPTNVILARALGIPHVPPVLREIPLLEVASQAPLQGNLDGTTAGLLQFDFIVRDGERRTAEHDNIGAAEVGAHAWLRFVEGWLGEGRAIIVDPYADLGLERE